jgi:hypothetical protein
MPLNTQPNIASPDDFFAGVIKLHEGLDDAQSMKVSARLILLLANHIGDVAILDEALRLARCDPKGDDAAS